MLNPIKVIYHIYHSCIEIHNKSRTIQVMDIETMDEEEKESERERMRLTSNNDH